MGHRPRTIICMSAVVLLSLLAGCQQEPAPTPTPGGGAAAVTAAGASTQAGGTIRALGTVRPAQALQLSFAAAGPVQRLSARLGDEVQAGDLLAELDTAALSLELARAEQEIAICQAALDALLAGPGAAAVARAEDEHARQVAEARIALQIAQLQLEQATHQGQAAAVDIAQLGVRQAAAQAQQAEAQSPAAEVTIAEVQVARAQDALDRVQDEYRKALDRPWEPQSIRDGLVQAVQQAEWDLDMAKARLDAARSARRAHQYSMDTLDVQRSISRLQATQATDAQAAYTVTLALHAAEVARAQLALDALEAWTNPLLDPVAQHEVDQARARLRQAELAAAQIALQIEGAVLRAPFDGVIAAVHARPGEWAQPGTPVLEILDTTRWYVETRNVSELAIGQVRVGQRALVQVLALDKAEIEGTVDTISPVAVVQQGDTTYTLMIALEPAALNLRPGMNVQVEIAGE